MPAGLHDQDDTIVALSSASGRAALAVIRVSGPESESLLKGAFSKPLSSLPPRTLVLGYLRGATGEVIDQVMVARFPAPASYTGQDMVEITCHGSPLLVNQVLESLLARGARLADPGEFTERAFLSGKLDLAQAEAVRDLIDSQTQFQAAVARQQLGGRLSRRLSKSKAALIRVICQLETRLEFVEDEVEPESRLLLLGRLKSTASDLDRLVEQFQFGRQVLEGVQIAVVGKPNAGKSSIFNALLREDRAIVASTPGTTRDAVSESVDIEGLNARLIDTAGIRQTKDQVELLGVERTRRLLEEVDAAIFVLDGSRELEEADEEVWSALAGKPVVLAINKQDLQQQLVLPPELCREDVPVVPVAALEGQGVDRLRKATFQVCSAGSGLDRETPLVTNLRHQKCILRARESLERASSALEQRVSEELVVEDLRQTLSILGEITGETTVEDILGQIFSTFCIGK